MISFMSAAPKPGRPGADRRGMEGAQRGRQYLPRRAPRRPELHRRHLLPVSSTRRTGTAQPHLEPFLNSTDGAARKGCPVFFQQPHRQREQPMTTHAVDVPPALRRMMPPRGTTACARSCPYSMSLAHERSSRYCLTASSSSSVACLCWARAASSNCFAGSRESGRLVPLTASTLVLSQGRSAAMLRAAVERIRREHRPAIHAVRAGKPVLQLL